MAVNAIAVCGCSWSAMSYLPEYKGTHFSELLAQEFGARLHNFAVGGVSNFVIRLQIEEVLKLKPSLVIVSPTYFDRIEFPNKHTDPKGTVSLSDIYNPYVNNLEQSYITTGTITDLAEKNQPYIKEYLVNYYSPDVKMQTDRWVFRDGIEQLNRSNIKVLIQPQLLFGYNIEYVKSFLPVSDNIFIVPNEISLFAGVTPPNSEPGYHTSPEHQQRFTNRLISYIKECKLDL